MKERASRERPDYSSTSPPFIFPAASGLLLSNYVGAIVLALRCPASFNVPVMVSFHAVMAAVLVVRALKLHEAGYRPDAIQSYYRWVWNFFYSEYAVFPFL